MNNRLLKIAKYLGKKGLYEEAAKVKKLASTTEEIIPPDLAELAGNAEKESAPTPGKGESIRNVLPVKLWAHLSDGDWKDIYTDSIKNGFFDWCKANGMKCQTNDEALDAINEIFGEEWEWKDNSSPYTKLFYGTGGNPSGAPRRIPIERRNRVAKIVLDSLK